MQGSELLFKGWHEFYLLLGTAAGTLVGLMFVAASVGAHIFDEKNRPALQVFLGPTVVHFTTVLTVSILALVPSHVWISFAALFAIAGLIGLPYSLKILFQITRRREEVELLDHLFYALVPILGYLLVLAAAVLLYFHTEWGLDFAAAALVTLLLAGIRNAWDMTLWIVMKLPNDGQLEK